MSTHSHNHNIDFKTAFTVTNEEKSQVKITGEIPYEELAKERLAAIKSLGKNVEIDGFRKGHVPEAVLVKHIGEMAILTEMAERSISHMYPHILEEHKIDAIGYPKIEITKIAPENPLGFTATVAIIPEVGLPDYKKIATAHNAEKGSADVTDTELEDKIKDILRQKAAYERLQKKAAQKPDSTEVTDLPTPETVNKEDEELDIAELTDEVAKSLGQPGQFTDVADFKAKLREHLEIEKKREVAANHRAKLTDAIIEMSTIELPQILIDSELNQMFAQMEEDLKRSNLKMEDYLNHIKKTKEEIQKEWTPAAEKRAKLQLILNEIAKKEKIIPDAELVEKQVKELLEMYKDADEMRVRTYVGTILTNEAVLAMLEGRDDEKKEDNKDKKKKDKEESK
ncbi:MAG: trigger factor [Candidatus Nomurabacteria bacterium]|nr:MAG: trigger factor [Candidatus Nomurabacteria bacterium]